MKKAFYILIAFVAASCIYKNSNSNKEQDSFTAAPKQQNSFERRIAYNDSLNKVLKWRQIEDDLYINKNGELGIIAFRLLNPPDEGYVYYQTHLTGEKSIPLNSIIDATTFKRIGGGSFGAYYKDNKHIYHTFGTSGGTNFSVVSQADYTTFEIIEECYGRDKNHIYDMRFGLMEGINPKEFIILPGGNNCIAKYRDRYYSGNAEINEELLKDPKIQKAIKQLDAYIVKTKHQRN